MHQFLIECIDKNTITVKRIIVRLEEIVLIIPFERYCSLEFHQRTSVGFLYLFVNAQINICYSFCRRYRYDVYIRKDVIIEGATNHLPLSHLCKVIKGTQLIIRQKKLFCETIIYPENDKNIFLSWYGNCECHQNIIIKARNKAKTSVWRSTCIK